MNAGITGIFPYEPLTQANLQAMKSAGINTVVLFLWDGTANAQDPWNFSSIKSQVELVESESMNVIISPNQNFPASFWNQYNHNTVHPTTSYVSAPPHNNAWFLCYSIGYDPNDPSTYNSVTGNTVAMETALTQYITEVMSALSGYTNIIAWSMKNCPTYSDTSIWYDWNIFNLQEFVYEYIKPKYSTVNSAVSTYGMPISITSWNDMVIWIYDNVYDVNTYSTGSAPQPFTDDFILFRRQNSADWWNFYANVIKTNDPLNRPVTIKNSANGDPQREHGIDWYDLLYDSYDILGCEADFAGTHANWIYDLLRSNSLNWTDLSIPLWCCEVEAWRSWNDTTWNTVFTNIQYACNNQGLTGLWWSNWNAIKDDSYKLQRVTEINNWLIDNTPDIEPEPATSSDPNVLKGLGLAPLLLL